MITGCEELKPQKNVYLNANISPFVFDFFCAIKNIKSIDSVDSLYLNSVDDKLEIYVFYEKEDFEIEDKITKELTNWEEQYKFFPEFFIYPLDMIEGKELTLPETAKEY